MGGEGEGGAAGTVGTPWVAFSVGEAQACGIKADGVTWCWGQNDSGQLGDGTFVEPLWAVKVKGPTFVQLSSGDQHVCALGDDRTLWCWGSNSGFESGGPASLGIPAPHQIGGDGDWALVSSGGQHTCATKIDGSLWCWGNGDDGQLGFDIPSPSPMWPARRGEDSDWAQVSSGHDHTCAIKNDASLWCWGRNSSGEVGDGTNEIRLEPFGVPSDGHGWKRVSAGFSYTCAVRGDGTLWCWGSNSTGQIGADVPASFSPLQVGADAGWKDVSAGQRSTCAVDDQGLRCWGLNQLGECGNGTTDPVSFADSTLVAGPWVGCGVSDPVACALRPDGQIYCAGVPANLGPVTSFEPFEP